MGLCIRLCIHLWVSSACVCCAGRWVWGRLQGGHDCNAVSPPRPSVSLCLLAATVQAAFLCQGLPTRLFLLWSQPTMQGLRPLKLSAKVHPSYFRLWVSHHVSQGQAKWLRQKGKMTRLGENRRK